jgi:hypothetical protein
MGKKRETLLRRQTTRGDKGAVVAHVGVVAKRWAEPDRAARGDLAATMHGQR